MDFRVCKNCLMDTTAQEIVFTETGCNFCDQARKSIEEAEVEKPNLFKILREIKNSGKGKKYDVLIGLSGGVDSSTVLHHAVQLGLRPLCYSIDNGWQNDNTQENIMRLVETLKVPFYRYTIDIPKFVELQGAFMKAGIKNLEVLSDHILFASTYEMAAKYGIKYVISGGNVATESIMPGSWGEDPRDLYWIKSIYRKITGKKLKGLPTIPLWKEQYCRLVRGIKTVRLLDYLDYNREEAIELLQNKYGYKSYGEKHCESVFTWWYQNYYLYQKWGIDKRKAHLSSLIVSGQTTRKEALLELQSGPVYPKLGLEKQILEYPKQGYDDFPNSKKIRELVVFLYRLYRKYANS